MSVLASYYTIGYKKKAIPTEKKIYFIVTILQSKCIDFNLKDATWAAFYQYTEKLIVVADVKVSAMNKRLPALCFSVVQFRAFLRLDSLQKI